MIEVENKIERYETYKDTGIEWLGDIPAHWEVNRLKYFGNIYSGLNGKNANDFKKEFNSEFKPYIPFTNIYNNTVIDDANFDYVHIKINEEQNEVLKYDIFFLMSSETIEDIGKCSIYLGDEKFLYLNSFCKGFRIQDKSIFPLFLNYLMLSGNYRKYFETVGRGFTRINLKQKYINNVSIVIPPLPEQIAIANLLDEKTQKIDHAISIKEQQIELLKERKQIIIHKAVTRGLNENVELKDSGVEWIGLIPKHWEVKKLKFLGNSVLGKMLCNVNKGNYYLRPYLKSKNIQWLKVEVSNVDEMWFSKTDLDLYRLAKDDLIISEGGEVGKTCIWNNEMKECYIQNSAHKVTLNDDCIPEYYLFLFFAIGKSQVFTSIANKVSIGHLTKDKLINIELVHPPLSEQKEISDYIETASKKIVKAIHLKQQEIEKLKEYKSSLINSVVTGKIKVC